LGNILQKIGLERVAHKVHVKRPGEWVRTVIQNLPWWCGIGVSSIATIAYFGALGRYNISLVQPMMSLNPVLTAIAGWLFLKETLDRRTAVAIFIVVLGLGFAGMLHGEAHGEESEQYLAFFTIACAVGIGLVRLLIHNVEARKSLIAGVGFGLSAVFMKSLEGHYLFHGGTFSLALVVDPGLVLRGIGFVITYLLGFVYMQVALTHGRALFVIPLTSAIGMLVPTLAGIVVFQEPFGAAKLCAVGLVALGSALFIKLR
jgi:drug/metabolite transporter (DMT)-like permease